MPTNKLLCIYHSNCVDGFGAAWVVRKALGEENVEFVPGIYGEEPPDVRGRNVVIVDFSYKRDVMASMALLASSILVLDHHKSAEKDLENLSPQFHNLDIVFDMTRSGAKITWDHYFPHSDPPRLLWHIQDRDLWQFKLDGTREIQATLFSYPYDFNVWDELMAQDVTELVHDGIVLERKHFKDLDELLRITTRKLFIGGFVVPAANIPYMFASDAGHLLAQGEPFAVTYYDTPNDRTFSLRSTDLGMDVSAIAQLYGGGGHKHAAGFKLPYSQLSQLDISSHD